jgi:hypothetical protein
MLVQYTSEIVSIDTTGILNCKKFIFNAISSIVPLIITKSTELLGGKGIYRPPKAVNIQQLVDQQTKDNTPKSPVSAQHKVIIVR